MYVMYKKNIFAKILILISIALFVACSSGEGSTKAGATGKSKAIIVASFGTTHADTRAVTLDAIQNKIANTFTDHSVYRAFTSNIIRKILKKRGTNVDSVEEAIQRAKNDGVKDLIIQPLHIIPGEEYNKKILEVASKHESSFNTLKIGRPVLTTDEDYNIAIDALLTQIPTLESGKAVVLMGHGTHHKANEKYAGLQKALYKKGINNVFVGTVEGSPTLDDVIAVLKKNSIKEVTLMPYMIVAGDHAKNDMAGDEDDSWKTILTKKGYKVNIYLHGLGENKEYQKIFVNHIKDLMK